MHDQERANAQLSEMIKVQARISATWVGVEVEGAEGKLEAIMFLMASVSFFLNLI